MLFQRQKELSTKQLLCAKCHSPTTSPLLCERCAQRLFPQEKKNNRPWYEPPTEKGLRRFYRLQRKREPIKFSDIILPPEPDPQVQRRMFTNAVRRFWEEEARYIEVRDHADIRRLMLVEGWRDWLRFQAGERRYKRWVLGNNPDRRGRPVKYIDDIKQSDDRYDRRNSVSLEYAEAHIGRGWDAELPDDLPKKVEVANATTIEYLNWQSTERFFQEVIEKLSVEDIYILMIHVHRLMAIRDNGNERACTTKVAAQLYFKLTGELLTAPAYRKRVERMQKAFGHDPEIWVKYRFI